MENPDKPAFSELVGMMKSWIPRRSDPSNVSRNFWMPDSVCVACYECDSPFTLFNRRHHCRLCGRIFCGKCTTNSIPSLLYDSSNNEEEVELVRVCNYCFKQWEQEMLVVRNGGKNSSEVLSPSLSTMSLASSNSNALNSCSLTPSLSYTNAHGSNVGNGTSGKMVLMHDDGENPSSNNFEFHENRSYDEEEENDTSRSDSETQHFTHSEIFYGPAEYYEGFHYYDSSNIQSVQENDDTKDSIDSPLHNQLESHDSLDIYKMAKETVQGNNIDEHTSSIYSMEHGNNELVDFDNNELLWFPPEPEDEEDDVDNNLFDDDDDEDTTEEWGGNRSVHSSCSGEYRSREKTNEEHKKAMKNVVDGHFRALIAQLLQVENVPIGEDGDKSSWLEIIMSLSWEAATLLKPDTSKGGGMDPAGYVKIKCIACGHPSQS